MSLFRNSTVEQPTDNTADVRTVQHVRNRNHKQTRQLLSRAQSILDQSTGAPADLGVNGIADLTVEERIGFMVGRIRDVAGAILHPNQVACALALVEDATIVELATGEGKTYAALAAAVAASGDGPGVHVATANAYLARRDAETARELLGSSGITVGVIDETMSSAEKQAAYQSSIVFGAANEFGFDYLRDSSALRPSDLVQGARRIAIVDEADSVLIDDATTPLIISAVTPADEGMYQSANDLVADWEDGIHYDLDRATKQFGLRSAGINEAEEFFHVDNLFDPANAVLAHHVDRAVTAHKTQRRDVDYAVVDGSVHIVDTNTGRIAPGRQWSDGLHQAVQVKEGLTPDSQSATAATISVQAYWSSYEHLSGLTGTTEGAEEEFERVFDSTVLRLPSHRPVIREDAPDVIWGTVRSKWAGIVAEIVERHSTGQPVLAGCVDIADSELLSRLLSEAKIQHVVLNAKNPDIEAEAIAKAGDIGSVTIATAMAGRGVDILIGGGDEVQREAVRAVGGLAVIGCGRHRSRRVDDQLRGRAGRQGDPGFSQFHVSLEDDLVANHGKLGAISALIGDGAVTSKLASKAVESAQRNIEDAEYSSRVSAVEYEEVIWGATNAARLRRDRLWSNVQAMRSELDTGIRRLALQEADRVLSGDDTPSSGIWASVADAVAAAVESGDVDAVTATLVEHGEAVVEKKWAALGDDAVTIAAQVFAMVAADRWSDFLAWAAAFRDGVNLRSVGGLNPLVIWKTSVAETYDDFVGRTAGDLAGHFVTVNVTFHDSVEKAAEHAAAAGGIVAS